MGKWLVLPTMFVVVGLLYARAPDAFSSPQFYGEDASVFWIQWHELGFATLWKPYAGYLDLYNRMAVAFTSLTPYRFHPAVFVFFAALAYAWTAATISTARLPVGLGAALAISMMLIPHDAEVWASLVNVHWVMACALPVIASTAAPDNRCSRINQILFVAMVSLTGPFSTIAMPLWLLRAHRDWRAGRERFGLTICAIAAAASCVQTFFVLNSPPEPVTSVTEPRPVEMLLAMIGRSGLDYLANLTYPVGIALLVALTVAALLSKGKWQRANFLAFAILILIPVFHRFYIYPEVMTARAIAGRYFFIPSIMVLWTAVSMMWTGSRFLIPIGAVASLAIVLDQSYHFIRTPREVMDDWSEKSQLIGYQRVKVKVPPGWLIDIRPKKH